MPTPPASATSRKPRRLEDSAGVREGRKYSASISRTMVTTSTDNWVSARSGAEKRAKARATSRPATLRINSATRRIRWNSAVARPLKASTSMPRAVIPSSGVSPREPVSLASGASSTATTTSAAPSSQAR